MTMTAGNVPTPVRIHFKNYVLFLLALMIAAPAGAQKIPFRKPDHDYLTFRDRIVTLAKKFPVGPFGEFIPGVREDLQAGTNKVVALTFDACTGAPDDYNAALIEFLRREKIPATLFISGKWIDYNRGTFLQLAKDSLFEIENHGLLHRVCSVNGRTKYKQPATKSAAEVVDEMELNARKIEALTGRRPRFFRPATAFCDEQSVQIARLLNMEVVSYDILSGDAIPFTPARIIAGNIEKKARPGAIIIMHFNHPKWFERTALESAIPALRKAGFRFVQLKNYPLTGSPR
jgi:peptidoglycan/xylan/chitin deacetylase (PgdA/CDA1 family)